MARLITALLHATVYLIEAIGHLAMLLSGYGLFWGVRDNGPARLKAWGSTGNLLVFYTGLAISPILFSLVISIIFDNWWIAFAATITIVFLVGINKLFGKNLFIPLLGILVFISSLITGAVFRISFDLMLFLVYLLVFFLAPVLLILFLTMI